MRKFAKKATLVAIFFFLNFTVVSADTTPPATQGTIVAMPSFTPPPPIVGTGKLSFFFQDIEIRTLLQLIAKNSGFNFIINDAVKGKVTLNLKNVTWRQALDMVMKSNGLEAVRNGNIMYISTIEDITSNESKQLQSEQALSNLAPLESTIIQLKYANAKDLADFLKGQEGTLLTTRGQVAVVLSIRS